MESRVVFIASLCPAQSFDSFTMQRILVSEITAIWKTKSQVDPRRDSRDYDVTKNADGRTDRQHFSFIYKIVNVNIKAAKLSS